MQDVCALGQVEGDMSRRVARRSPSAMTASPRRQQQIVRGVLKAYGEGAIALDQPDKKSSKDHIRHARQNSGEHPYTAVTPGGRRFWGEV
jgi:hypothetical protein